ncbi:MAG: tetratricopeptide repeat protein, partial [Gammaproteobacteria bacterium]
MVGVQSLGRVAVIAAFLVAIVVSAGCDRMTSNKERRARATVAQERGDHRSAIIDLKTVLQTEPDNGGARKQLGMVYLDLSNGAEAAKELKRARDLGVPAAELAIPLVRALSLYLAYEEAAETAGASLIEADSAGPDYKASLLALQGHAYLAFGKVEKARANYAQALSFSAAAPDALLGNARIAVFEQNRMSAKTLLKALLETSPKFADAWRLLADLNRIDNLPTEAEAAYDNTIANRAFDPDSHLYRGLMRVALNKLDAAREDLSWLQKKVKGAAGTFFLGGVIAFADKRYADAETELLQTLKVDENYAFATYYLALATAEQGKYEQAEANFSSYLRRIPSDLAANKALAALKLRRGDAAGAKNILLAQSARAPDDDEIAEMLAQIEFAVGDPAKGVEILKKIAANSATSSKAYLQLGLEQIGVGA